MGLRASLFNRFYRPIKPMFETAVKMALKFKRQFNLIKAIPQIVFPSCLSFYLSNLLLFNHNTLFLSSIVFIHFVLPPLQSVRRDLSLVFSQNEPV